MNKPGDNSKRNVTVVLYGPPGSGKSHYAEKIKRYFGLSKIVDGVNMQGKIPRYDHLIITNENPPEDFTHSIRLRWYHIDDLKKVVGSIYGH